jgi:hypothetical protein
VDMWTIGVADRRTSPAFPSELGETREMLAFAQQRI